MAFTQQAPPTIILLKGDTSQGKGQLISNINACLAIQDTIRMTVSRFLELSFFSHEIVADDLARSIRGG